MKLRKVITTAGFMFAGVSSANAQLYMCQSCPAGSWSDGTFKNCKNCSAGYYSSAGASSCSICSAGTYSTAGSSSCSTCSAGYYCPGGTDKKVCPAGYYSSAGASSCTLCPVGYYCSGGTDKQQCPMQTAESGCFSSAECGSSSSAESGSSSSAESSVQTYSNAGATSCTTDFSLMKEYYSVGTHNITLSPGTYKIELIGGGGGAGGGSWTWWNALDGVEDGCKGNEATMQSQIVLVPSESTATVIVGDGGNGGNNPKDNDLCTWGKWGSAGQNSSFTVLNTTISSDGGTPGRGGGCGSDQLDCPNAATCSTYGCGGSGGKEQGKTGNKGKSGYVKIYRLVDE